MGFGFRTLRQRAKGEERKADGRRQTAGSSESERLLAVKNSLDSCISTIDGDNQIATASANDVRPPSDAIFFPTGMAVAPDDSVLFVAEANSELRYDSGAVSVSPRRSLPACVLVVDCCGGAVGPATAIAASAPAPKTAAPSTTDRSAFFMRGLTASSIVEQPPPLSTGAKRLACPAEGVVQRLNATAARGTCRTPPAGRPCTRC